MGEGQVRIMRNNLRRLSVIMKDLKDRVAVHVRENSRFTIDEIHEVFS
jgi:hypothetical protein